MTQIDEFVPAVQQMQPAQPTPEMQATIKQAEVVADPRFLGLVKFSALMQQTLKTVGKLETDEDQANAIVAFDRVKKALKGADELRHEVVDFPTKFVKLINDMFRPLTQQLEGVKQHFSSLLSAYDALKRKQAEEAAKAAELAAAKGGQEQLQLDENGDGKVTMEPQAPPPVPTVTKVEGTNAKVTMREVLEMKILDPVQLLKAIISDSKRNEAYTMELITFNEPAIKKLCEGKRKIPGVQWEKVKKAV